MPWKRLKVTAEEMKGLADAALLAALAMGSVLGASALVQASWPRRSPAAAILLWQALGLAGGLAAVGTLVSLGLPGNHLGVARSLLHLGTVFPDAAFRFPAASGTVSALPAMLLVFRLTCLAGGLALLASLCWVLIAVSAAALHARRRQRALLALLAHGDPKVPGALVVDYPTVAAYCLRGLFSPIVVLSVGTVELPGRGELAPGAGVGARAVRHRGHLPGTGRRARGRGGRHGRPGGTPASARTPAARGRERIGLPLRGPAGRGDDRAAHHLCGATC